MYKSKNMKKGILIIFLFISSTIIGVKAQVDSISVKPQSTIVQLDSLTIAYIDACCEKFKIGVPRYKMFKTENTYNLIKLDTATGRVWLVQYGMNDIEATTSAIDDYSLLWSYEEERAGRFDLYPTNNMYNFILIDTETGRTWQVQWHTSYSKRFRSRIY